MNAFPVDSRSLPKRAGPGLSDARKLLSQVAWFNKLRFAAAGGMAVLATVSQVLGLLQDHRPLFALATITLLLNLFYEWRYPRLAHVASLRIRRHVDLQIVFDLLILTALLHWSGGVTNPLVLFYLFHTFIAALLLSVAAATFVAAASLILVASLGLAERHGVLPHWPVTFALFDLMTVTSWALITAWVAFAATFGFSIYFVANVLRQLHHSEQELVMLDRQLGQSEKLASVGTLAAGVSHEINNPVGVIQSKVQILRYRIADGDPASVLESELDVIEKHARRIGSVTAGLLTFAREEPFELRPLDLNDVVAEGVDLVQVPFQTAGIHLIFEQDESRPQVQGSQNHMLSVLVNILLNARDASQRGSTVTVSTFVQAEEACIRIKDQGAGIAPEVLPKIFDPFFTTKEVDRGTGLGLAISHGIVERHGGRILVESPAEEGTTFTILLPLLDWKS